MRFASLSPIMSTSSLPSYYLAPTLPSIPAYSEEPQQYEQRLAFATSSHPRSSKAFVKHSKNGDAKLTLNGQDGRVPAYGSGGVIDGSVDIMKTEGVTNVEIKVCAARRRRIWGHVDLEPR